MIRVLPKIQTVVIYTPDGDLAMLGTDQITSAFYRATPKGKGKETDA
jgi:hypothetical protein